MTPISITLRQKVFPIQDQGSKFSVGLKFTSRKLEVESVVFFKLIKFMNIRKYITLNLLSIKENVQMN